MAKHTETKKPFEGFNRIVINNEGEAWDSARAMRFGIYADVGFMRNDGWALGAPKEFEDVAFRLWADEWKYVIRKNQTEWTPL